jgi:L-threonylcarbamoyladenylate synthase
MQIINIKDKKMFSAVIKALKNGKVIAFPTDTVYGLLTNAHNKTAVNKIFEIKKRVKNKYLSIFVKDIKTAKKIAKTDKQQEELINKSWPGQVTFILEKRKRKNKMHGIDEKKIALRVPNYKPLNDLLKKLDFPVVQTSANISGQKYLKTGKEIAKILKHIDLIVDAGKITSKHSTIIDLTVSPPRIIRH